MDASKDLMNATYDLLSREIVKGSLCLPVDQLVELLDRYVVVATSQLRHLAVPSIVGQIIGGSDGLPTDWQQKRAVMVYEAGLGTQGYADVEYWFVDRDKAWYWVKNDKLGHNAEYAQVSSRHLAERQVIPGSDGAAYIHVLGSVARSFAARYSEAAVSARRRVSALEAAASKMSALDQVVRQIRDPSF